MSIEACLKTSQGGHPFSCPLLISDPRPVVPSDVLVYRTPERIEAFEFRFMPVKHFVLHRREERFHYAVVEAVPLPRHRLEYPPLLQLPHVPAMLILPALVGMEYEPVQVVSEGERLLEHPLRLGQVRVEAEVVGDDPAVVHVLDGAEVAFPPRERELAHVGRPLLVRPRAREIGFVMDLAVLPHVFHDDQVVRDLPDVPPIGVVIDGLPLRGKAGFPHQPLHFLVVDGEAEGTELRGDPADPVTSLGGIEDLPDLADQPRVLRVEIAPFGLVEIGGFGKLCDGEQVAQFGFREFPFGLEDCFVLLPWLRSSGSAKALIFLSRQSRGPACSSPA